MEIYTACLQSAALDKMIKIMWLICRVTLWLNSLNSLALTLSIIFPAEGSQKDMWSDSFLSWMKAKLNLSVWLILLWILGDLQSSIRSGLYQSSHKVCMSPLADLWHWTALSTSDLTGLCLLRPPVSAKAGTLRFSHTHFFLLLPSPCPCEAVQGSSHHFEQQHLGLEEKR